MKIIAHRGWSQGKNENTIAALETAKKTRVDGIELDIRQLPDGEIVLAHDPIIRGKKYTSLIEALLIIQETDWMLFLEFKEYNKTFFNSVVTILRKYRMLERTIAFGFPNAARHFPWKDRTVPLGIISHYPWRVRKDIERFQPDYIMMGWDTEKHRMWFMLYWSLFSLKRFIERFPNVKFVMGIVRTKEDFDWLIKQNPHATIADKPRIWH